MSEWFSYPNRLVCSVLDEMRKMLDKLDEHNVPRYKSAQSMLIEEAQTLVNRMESALEDHDDIRRVRKELKKLEKQIKDKKEEKDSADK